MAKWKFVDFCAGIGGGRIGLERAGMECIGFSEIDAACIRTYQTLFGTNEPNFGDLMKINPKDLPDFDLLIAGFPCQSFSSIGKRNGLNDSRGQIIFGIIKILREKAVKFFILENVKGLLHVDNGKAMQTILQELQKASYRVFWKVLNSCDFGVPHRRERVFFVGIRKDLVNSDFDFSFPEPLRSSNISEFLIDEDDEFEVEEKDRGYEYLKDYLNNKYNKGRFRLTDLLKREYLIIDARHLYARLYFEVVPTLRAKRHGIFYVKNSKLRKLSGYEALLLQGFDRVLAEKAKHQIKNTTLLEQAGNAITANVVHAIAEKLHHAVSI